MPQPYRQAIVARLASMAREKKPIIGAATGLSAKCEEMDDSRPDRHLQFGALPHGRARFGGRASRVRQRQRDRQGYGARGSSGRQADPVLTGVNATDPFVLMPQFLAELKTMGFAGLQNFPTVGLFDRVMRASWTPPSTVFSIGTIGPEGREGVTARDRSRSAPRGPRSAPSGERLVCSGRGRSG